MGKDKRHEKITIEIDRVIESKKHSREVFKNMPRSKFYEPKNPDDDFEEYDIEQAVEDFATEYLGLFGIEYIEIKYTPYPVICAYTDIHDSTIPKSYADFEVKVEKVSNFKNKK
jgi:hypothetical protein